MQTPAIVEIPLRGTPPASDPLAVRLEATLMSPSGALRRITGFWDGDNLWKIRFAPDERGDWVWRSRSDLSDLDGREGRFAVSAATPPSRGPVGVHRSGRALCRTDGTPVFWLADTLWAVPAHATPEEWADCVAVRAAQGFNVVQLNTLPQWDGSGPPARLPFATGPDGFDVARPQSDYFHTLDRMVALASGAGLTPALVVLWFDMVPDDNTDWHVPRQARFDPAAAASFARWLVGRYEAFSPVWIVSGDSAWRDPAAIRAYEAAAYAIRESSASRPLVTAHLKGGLPTPDKLNRAGWLDFHMFQSGHTSDSPSRSAALSAHDRRLLPTRPVMNAEPCYEGLRAMDRGAPRSSRISRDDLRRTLWVSLLSGATAGVTYGAHGIWPWHRDGQAYAARQYGIPIDWRVALRLPGAEDAARLKAFAEELPWWELEPRAGVVSDPGDALLAVAATAQDALVVVYVARPTRLCLPFGRAAGAEWLDPATGYRAPADVSAGAPECTVAPHAWPGDAVLALRPMDR